MSTQKRSSGCYYSRLRVPSDLRQLLGRREVIKSLSTTSYREANLLAKSWEANVADLFNQLRQNGMVMTKQQINQVVSEYLHRTLDDCEEDRLQREVSEDEHDGVAFAITDALETNRRADLHRNHVPIYKLG